MQHDLDPLTQQAKRVLDLNWSGSYTKPGPRLYPHQWSWDSAFVAIGYACYEQERAITELRHLFSNQWSNGLLPQIVFNPAFNGYFPGMSFWHAECSQNARCKLNTSGVVRPPLHATAALCVYRRASNAEGGLVFLEEMYPRLVAWHEYLYRERDPEGEGLAYIRHPWESGMDNSPMWDAILQRMQLRPDQIPKYQRADTHVVPKEDRPEEAAYGRFAYLVQLFEQRDYEEVRIREDCPFLVQDVLFNVLLCQAEQDLAQIAQILGEDSSPHEARVAKTAGAIDRKLWDEDTGSTSNSTWSPASLLAYTLPQASSPCTLEFPMESEPSVCSRAWRTRGSVSRMKARYPSPATTATATGSHPCGTGGVRFGSTSTGC